MIDLTCSNDIPKNVTAVAMGLFDGLHRGHSAVISTAVEIARENQNVSPALFTFNTGTVISKGENGVDSILSHELKYELIEKAGIEYIYSPDFMSIKNLSATEFAERILRGALNARYVICGEDFRLGKGASTDASDLEIICNRIGLKLYIIPSVKDEDGNKISSTSIREYIKSGDIEKANKLLGYRYQLKMPVVYGNQLGRTIDFPTINQHIPERQVIPAFGVYASEVEIEGNIYSGLTNIGIKPTVQNLNTPLAETYIIGYNGMLYGKVIRLSLISFIRPEIKFESLNELSVQIRKDISSLNDTLNDTVKTD